MLCSDHIPRKQLQVLEVAASRCMQMPSELLHCKLQICTVLVQVDCWPHACGSRFFLFLMFPVVDKSSFPPGNTQNKAFPCQVSSIYFLCVCRLGLWPHWHQPCIFFYQGIRMRFQCHPRSLHPPKGNSSPEKSWPRTIRKGVVLLAFTCNLAIDHATCLTIHANKRWAPEIFVRTNTGPSSHPTRNFFVYGLRAFCHGQSSTEPFSPTAWLQVLGLFALWTPSAPVATTSFQTLSPRNCAQLSWGNYGGKWPTRIHIYGCKYCGQLTSVRSGCLTYITNLYLFALAVQEQEVWIDQVLYPVIADLLVRFFPTLTCHIVSAPGCKSGMVFCTFCFPRFLWKGHYVDFRCLRLTFYQTRILNMHVSYLCVCFTGCVKHGCVIPQSETHFPHKALSQTTMCLTTNPLPNYLHHHHHRKPCESTVFTFVSHLSPLVPHLSPSTFWMPCLLVSHLSPARLWMLCPHDFTIVSHLFPLVSYLSPNTLWAWCHICHLSPLVLCPHDLHCLPLVSASPRLVSH